MPIRPTNDFETWYGNDLGPETADNAAANAGAFETWYANDTASFEQAASVFPKTPLLDNFNRADEALLSGGGTWSYSSRWGLLGLELVSNQVRMRTGGPQQGSTWNAPIPVSTESYATLAVAPVGGQFIEFDLIRPTGVDGYAWAVYGNGTSQPYRITSGGMVTLGPAIPITLANGDGLGIKYDDATATFTGWRRSTVSGGWTKLFSIVDATHDGPWYLTYGLSAGTEIDDVGGGGARAAAATSAPVTDLSVGGWTNELGSTPLYASVDEAAASDTDYIQSSLSPFVLDEARLTLAPLNTPIGTVVPVIQYRYGKDQVGGHQINLRVRLYAADGVTVIAEQTHTSISTITVGTLTLTPTQTAAIPTADYATGLVLGFGALAI